MKGLNPVWVRKSQDTETLGREYWQLPYQPLKDMTQTDYLEGNIPAEFYAAWAQYQGLSDIEKEDFLEAHPELSRDFRQEYRKTHPMRCWLSGATLGKYSQWKPTIF